MNIIKMTRGKGAMIKTFFKTFLIPILFMPLIISAGCVKHPAGTGEEHATSETGPCGETGAEYAAAAPEQQSATSSTGHAAAPPVYETASSSKAPAEDYSHGTDYASELNASIHDIAVQIIENLQSDPGTEGIIGVATFVDLNNLYRTSPFGRYLAEQLMGELQRAGFHVVEVRKTDSLLIKERFGEYSLSRQIQEIAKQTSARMILLGTYLAKGDYIFVNARLVSSANSTVASSALQIMEKDSFMKKMLWPAAAPQTGHAIKVPVKAFGEPTEIRIIQGS